MENFLENFSWKKFLENNLTAEISAKKFLENNPYSCGPSKNKRMDYPKISWKINTSAKFKKIANVYEIRILRPSHKMTEWSVF